MSVAYSNPNELLGTQMSRAERRIVIELATDGPTNKEIARRLHLAEGTVRHHINTCMRRTGTHTRAGLALWWRDNA